jgi:hypothetical protein
MTPDDVQILFNYFDMVVLSRFLVTFEKRANASSTELNQYLVQANPRLLDAAEANSTGRGL